MALKKAAPSPPSAEAREHVWDLIRSSSVPLTATQLVKALDVPHKMREKDLVPILQEEAAAGRLFAFPGKTAAGKPRYWDRDEAAILRAAAIEAMERSETPVTVAELVKRMEAPWKISAKDVTPIAEEQVAAGAWHAIPKATPKGRPRYWNHGVVEYGRAAIRQTLQAKGPQTEANLRKAVKGVSNDQFRESLRKAVESGQAWPQPPLGKSKQKLLGAKPPSPEKYLQEVGKQLSQVVARLNGASVSREDLRRAVVQMVEAAGVSFAGTARTIPENAPAPAVPTFDLIALMKRLEPGAERGALVGARDLRRVAELGKQEFDRAVLELARQGRLSLHRHDFVSSLSVEEREELVSDGNGTHYVGIALRQN